jgi:PAS domain S-box-containing protein
VRRSLVVYSAALAILAAMLLLRELLDPILGNNLPFVTLFGAVAAAVWLGGALPGIAVTVVGYFAAAYFFIEPRGQIVFSGASNIVGLLAFLFTSGLIVVIGEASRRAHIRANEHRELLRVTLRSIGDAVVTTDVDGRITYLNAVAEALTGWTHADAMGRPLDAVFRIVNEKTRETVASPAARALREGVVVGLANHTVLIRKDGAECPIDDSAAPIRDEAGNVSGCVLIFRDVTEQRRVERDKASQLMTARVLASIVDSSDDAIVSKSLDGIIRSWNGAAERLFGYSAEEAVGRHISLVIPADRIAEEEMIVGRLKKGERVDHFETERQRADGRRVAVSLTISPLKDDDGQVIGASKIARDITERKKVEAEREQFVTVVENSTDFIGMCDLQGMPFFVNRAGLAMVGLRDIDEARHTPVREFFFPEDQPRVMGEFFASVMKAGHGEIEVRFRHFQTGKALWMAYKLLALKDASGRIVSFATVSQDVTERRRLADDLKKLAADLSEADRRKDEFLAVLAHELRNPLAPLSNMIAVLKRSDDDPAVARQARETMERQLGQMVRLVDDLLDLNRISHSRLELRQGQVELATVIQQALEAARPLAAAAGHRLEVSLPETPVYLHADSARLAQVFGNLLTNSCKYTAPGGRIAVTARLEARDVFVSVKDNGAGIPADKLDRIFDMFLQLDRSMERSQGGLGIGLTLVKRLVEMHGGSIEAKSGGVGQGTEIIVRLPVLTGAVAAAAAPEPTADKSVPRVRRVLVVDDNNDAADSLAMLLRLSGIETSIANDGQEAVDLARAQRPDVILLDIGLPIMNGFDACRAVRAEPWGKSTVIIALTGWGQEEDRRRSKEAGFDGHLVKPVEPSALFELLRAQAPSGTDT